MDIRDDFFFNASLTLFSGPRMHGFSSSKIGEYKKTLVEFLTRVQEASEEPEINKGKVELKWKHWGNMSDHPGLSSDVTYSVEMVFIRYNRTLHRLCIITRHHLKNKLEILRHSVVVLANATPEVLDVCRYWMAKEFDTMLTPFEINQDAMFLEYDTYLRTSARASGFGTDSELVFSVEDSFSKKLRDITIAVSGQDLPGYLANSESVSETVMRHLEKTTAISLRKLRLSRINCSGLVLVAKGKMKIFREGTWAENEGRNLWSLIERLVEQQATLQEQLDQNQS